MVVKLSNGTTITDAQLKVSATWLSANYKPFSPTNGPSQYCILVAHGTVACIHADARIMAQRYFEMQGMPGELSKGSAWHSVKVKQARRRNSDGPHGRYDANARTKFGPALMYCTTAKHGTTRSDCDSTCLQGLAVDGNLVADITAGTTKPTKATGKKRGKSKGTRKNKRSTQRKVDSEVQNDKPVVEHAPSDNAPVIDDNDVTTTAPSIT